MPARHDFHPTILREYDVRGIVGETLFAADARALGQAYATILQEEGRGLKIAVGRDGRLSSPELCAALVDGLLAAGCEVHDVGLGPTPMLYFAVHHLGCDGGIQVTGSHNPPSHNGFKMMIGTASFFGDRIQAMRPIAETGAFLEAEGGKVRDMPVFDAYVARLAQDHHGTRPIHAIWDTGNGAAGPAVAALVKQLPGRHEVLFAEVDGRFPNHHPDPTEPENLEHLIERVRATGAELGIGFDGDGDRIGVVDGAGRMLFGDQLIEVLASDLLPRYPGAPIIADVKASQTLYDAIAQMGGKPVMWKTGHSLIKAKMAEIGAPMSGEMSGHIFYKDGFYGHDDALYVAVRLLDILARGTKTLADYKDAMPKVVNTPEIRIDCPDEKKFDVIAAVKERLAAQGAEVNAIDGVRVNTADGWWLMRASNTQAVLVARAEAMDAAGLERLKATIRAELDHAQVPVPKALQPA
ncbi:MAG: phosphomannomutase/phosphoglucomutase [Geminicoccaceae bacterium]|nr:MAG: phosphomannomutase/phosphoglucomutase [Geminicoccaceae bacterium]